MIAFNTRVILKSNEIIECPKTSNSFSKLITRNRVLCVLRQGYRYIQPPGLWGRGVAYHAGIRGFESYQAKLLTKTTFSALTQQFPRTGMPLPADHQALQHSFDHEPR